jgi:hypothetical protein
MAWYIWQDSIRLPISTLQRGGRWDLIDLAAKCTTLLLALMWTKGQGKGSALTKCIPYFKLQTYKKKPHIQRIPKTMKYLGIYALEIDPRGTAKRPKRSDTEYTKHNINNEEHAAGHKT